MVYGGLLGPGRSRDFVASRHPSATSREACPQASSRAARSAALPTPSYRSLPPPTKHTALPGKQSRVAGAPQSGARGCRKHPGKAAEWSRGRTVTSATANRSSPPLPTNGSHTRGPPRVPGRSRPAKTGRSVAAGGKGFELVPERISSIRHATPNLPGRWTLQRRGTLSILRGPNRDSQTSTELQLLPKPLIIHRIVRTLIYLTKDLLPSCTLCVIYNTLSGSRRARCWPWARPQGRVAGRAG